MSYTRINLDEECCDPDAHKERIAIQSFKDVPLTMNLACVDLVEKSHHNERVKDDGEVLRRTLHML